MNFNNVLEELNKLYEEEKVEKAEQLEDEAREEPVEEDCTKTLTEADEEEIEFAEEPAEPIEGDEAPVEGTVEEAESRQLILECSKCGAIVIKDEADVVIDEESDLVNVEDTCEYCEEAKGYKIIGVVAPYEAAEVSMEGEEAVENEESAESESEFVEEPVEVLPEDEE